MQFVELKNKKMGTYTQILYQIVFSTKNRENTLVKSNVEKLYRDIQGILKQKNCVLYQIGGIEDHIHIITHIHPSISLADLIKNIKLGSSSFIKESNIFSDFNGWQNGYAAFTYSQESKAKLINYVKKQELKKVLKKSQLYPDLAHLFQKIQ